MASDAEQIEQARSQEFHSTVNNSFQKHNILGSIEFWDMRHWTVFLNLVDIIHITSGPGLGRPTRCLTTYFSESWGKSFQDLSHKTGTGFFAVSTFWRKKYSINIENIAFPTHARNLELTEWPHHFYRMAAFFLLNGRVSLQYWEVGQNPTPLPLNRYIFTTKYRVFKDKKS